MLDQKQPWGTSPGSDVPDVLAKLHIFPADPKDWCMKSANPAQMEGVIYRRAQVSGRRAEVISMAGLRRTA